MSHLIRKVIIKSIYFCIGVLRSILDMLGVVIFHFIYGFQDRKKVPPIRDPILLLSATDLMAKYRAREVKCREVVEAYIVRLREANAIINAVAHNRYEAALKEADLVDEAVSKLVAECSEDSTDLDAALDSLWRSKPLLGLPVSVKEAFAVEGCPNCSGLATRSGVLATQDAIVVQRVRSAGAILLCVTNTSELCMWWESANHVYGRTNNPYDHRRIVGGSSGGEAAVLGAGASVCGLGSDIGGSIRIPSHFNGIFGHKATTRTLPNEGQYPIAEGKAVDFLLPGPMCRYAGDMRVIMNVLAEPEMRQRLRLDLKVTDLRQIEFIYMTDIGDRVFTSPVEPDIRHRLEGIVESLRALGCEVRPVAGVLKKMRRAFLLWAAKMSTSGTTPFHVLLADGHPEGFHIRKRLWDWLIGRSTHTIPALGLAIVEQILETRDEDNLKLCEEADLLKEELQQLLHVDADFEETEAWSHRSDLEIPGAAEEKKLTRPRYRVLLLPANPTTAPYHHQPLFRLCNFAYTGVFNVLGFPVTAVPVGLDHRGLPFALQVVGDMHHDFVTLSVAELFDRLFGGWVQP